MFFVGPFRNNDKIFLCDRIVNDLKQHDEILKNSVKNTTAYMKNVIGNKMEDDTIEKIKILNNQLEWIRNNLKNQ
jgi:hypothetical protein